MNAKWVCFLFAFFLSFLLVGVAPSTTLDFQENQGENLLTYQPRVILTNESTGEQVEFPVTVNNVTLASQNFLQYDVYIQGSYLKDLSNSDSTGGVLATLRMNYKDKYVGGVRYISINSYSAKWQKTDNTISITGCNLKPHVFGYDETMAKFYNQTYTRQIGTPALNTWYSTTPGWSGVYIKLDDFGYQTSELYSQLSRGGSVWTLKFCTGVGATDCD